MLPTDDTDNEEVPNPFGIDPNVAGVNDVMRGNGEPQGPDELGELPDELEQAGDPDAADEDAEPVAGNPLDSYWAAGPAEACIAMLEQKRREFFAVARSRGLVNMWRVANAGIYGQDPNAPGQFDTQTIGSDDAEGGQLRFRVNEPASFLKQSVTMATGQRASFQAVAENTDTAAMAMAPVVDSAVGYAYRKEMDDAKEQTFMRVEGGFGAAYVWARWEKWKGDEVKIGTKQIPLPPDKQVPGQPPQTAPIDVFGPSGAPDAIVLRPWEEFHEVRRRGGQTLWRCALERRSRFELMALYPALAEKLRSLENEGDHNEIEQEIFGSNTPITTHDDLIVQHFYHVPIGDPNDETNPLRAGRYFASVGALLLGEVTVLPTSRKVGLPIVEGMSLPMEDVAFGCAGWWDLLACQQGEDQVVSDMLSNITTFGRTSGFYDEEAEVDLDQLAAGGGWFAMPRGALAPQMLQPPAMPPTAPWLVEHTTKKKQSLSGLNATQRGDTTGVTSGEMAALFTNLAVEFNSDKQLMLAAVRRALANIFADLIERNAENDLLVQIVGVDERPYVQRFRPQLLKGFRAIEMQNAPPLMQTAPGRMQVQKMLEGISNPEERAAAIMLITTGQWRQMTDTSSAKWLLVKWENEQLSKGMQFPAIPPPPAPRMPGQPPPPDPLEQKAQLLFKELGVQVRNTDDDEMHVKQHTASLEQLCIDPITNQDAIATHLVHLQDHVAKSYSKDPRLAAMLKQTPPPGPPQQQQPSNNNANATQAQNPAAAEPDRLGSNVPEPAKPPKSAAVQGATA